MSVERRLSLRAEEHQPRFSKAAAEVIHEESRAAGGTLIASSSLWEIAMMSRMGRVRLPASLTEYLRYVEFMFIVLSITGAIAERAVLFSDPFPGDPTDRIIAATAVVHRVKLVTIDRKIRASKEVDCVW